MSRTANPTSPGESAKRPDDARPADTGSANGQPPATAAEVRHVYQALRTLVPERGRVTAADLAAVTDLERDRVAPAMARLASEGPFAVEPADTGDLAAWTVVR